MLKGIMFDFDGVIVETESKKFHDTNKTLKNYGIEIKKKYFPSFIGKKTGFFIKEKFPALSEKKINQIVKERRKLQLKNLNSNKLIHGIKSLLRYLQSKKYKLALVTGSKKEFILKILEIKKLSNYFDYIITGNDFKSSKPSSECYEIALKKMRLKPKEVIIIEDSVAGIKAAKKIRAPVFAISTYLKKNQLIKADKQFRNHAQILEYLKKIN